MLPSTHYYNFWPGHRFNSETYRLGLTWTSNGMPYNANIWPTHFPNFSMYLHHTLPFPQWFTYILFSRISTLQLYFIGDSIDSYIASYCNIFINSLLQYSQFGVLVIILGLPLLSVKERYLDGPTSSGSGSPDPKRTRKRPIFLNKKGRTPWFFGDPPWWTPSLIGPLRLMMDFEETIIPNMPSVHSVSLMELLRLRWMFQQEVLWSTGMHTLNVTPVNKVEDLPEIKGNIFGAYVKMSKIGKLYTETPKLNSIVRTSHPIQIYNLKVRPFGGNNVKCHHQWLCERFGNFVLQMIVTGRLSANTYGKWLHI